jgi:hypothetical protein
LKGLDMLIEAATPLARDGRLELDFIGKGPQMPQLEAQARQAGVGEAIRLHG